ncbi:DUF1837 domain-containing protein [Pseudoxanthomonas sp. SE1]|uniref:HamA C-terminal domain-containing protein n=1 Tax=Pseudoxanthomonas sp. SE1 TaxID=1664560 RepID=UPI00240E7FDC|nr:DUF1837 domain-containing protein [Pseudoxanthomonas sp. SE1]WFC40815.1 DUF1837 domain-containing protein [Pseudoxanthomonas sp. SE1]
MVTSSDIDNLLASTGGLFSNVYSFELSDLGLPGKSHRGAAIAVQDVVERRTDFIRELRNTMCSWVYSKAKYHEILSKELAFRNQDIQNAAAHVQELVKEKFRAGYPQGQFGELLLFNVIQHYFRAAPILRKMQITTNPAIERHGADAIHFRPDGEFNVLYIGEAKSYSSDYKFSEALGASLDSAITSLDRIQDEMSLYVYEGFIEEPLLAVAYDVKRNALKNVVYDIVCVVSYAEVGGKAGKNQAEVEGIIRNIVRDRMLGYADSFSKFDPNRLGKIHFFVMPFWDFKGILKEFEA